MEDSTNSMYALKTSVGQEKNVARMLARKVKDSGIEIKRYFNTGIIKRLCFG